MLRALVMLLAIASASLGCGLDEGAEGGGGVPVASFTQDSMAVEPGDAVQFTDTSSGNVTSWSWDFGAAGTRTERNPLVTFDAPGDYTVRLTVAGSSGSSVTERVDLIHVGGLPAAAFMCGPALQPETPVAVEYVPFDIKCTDASTGATSWAWDFGDGGMSALQSPTHQFNSAGDFTVRQTATNTVGSDEAETNITIHALDFTMTFDSDDSAPALVNLTAIDDGGYIDAFTWYVDGVEIGGGKTYWHTFLTPGEYEIELRGFDTGGGTTAAWMPSGNAIKTLDIAFGLPDADFGAQETGGFGPFAVAFDDLSAGVINRWAWTFGDGESCAWPSLPSPAPPGMTVCTEHPPTHVYDARGRYEVELTVTGDADADGLTETTDSETKSQFITVFLEDAGFEAQTADQEIGGAWVPVPAADDEVAPPVPVRHVAASRLVGGTDLGMPTDYEPGNVDRNGRLWAVIDGEGTDGSVAVESIEHGIRQDFLHDPARPVLEFDYVLLYAEPPDSPVLDATIATVSDGATTVPIATSYADTSAPYAGGSGRYEYRGGGLVSGTPVRVASIDLAAAFPAATADTLFTLMIRTSNADDADRSPLVYVDDVRFAVPQASITAGFDEGPGPFWTGQAVAFADTTCSDTNPTCIAETSWRWDFDTNTVPSAPDASGSAERNPSYVFDERGDYEVELTVVRGGADDSLPKTISVYDPVAAAFELDNPNAPDPPDTPQAPADLVFNDLSTSDPDDPIVAWDWDFGGWGRSTAPAPGPITFGRVGTYTVTLTVTTSLGGTGTATLEVRVE